VHVVEAGSVVATQDAGALLHTPPIASAVAVAICDPDQGIAGIAHFLLPDAGSDAKRRSTAPEMFAGPAVESLVLKLAQLGADGSRLRAYLVGGGDLVYRRHAGPCELALGDRNVAAARAALKEYGIRIVAARVGGNRARRVAVEVASAKVRITETPVPRRSRDGSS
jgi:chemotaxis protein CheD